ncbi:PQQ-like beta-propeller repeat protein [bacterium]|nr:PQQ-like beta-propeller repeat protein [bacterium]
MNRLITAVVISLTCFVATAQATDWLKPYQNSRNDREEVNIKLPLTQVWKKQGTIGQASPVYMDGKLYIQDRGGLIGKWLGDYLYINEVDIEKGEVKKRYRVVKVEDHEYQFIRMIGHKGKCYLSVIRADQSFRKKLVYIKLYAYDLSRKKVIWSWESGELNDYPGPHVSYMGAYMTGYENKLLLSSMRMDQVDKIFCFNTETGELLWKQKEPAGEIDDSYPVIADGKVFVGTKKAQRPKEGGHIAALDLETGKVIWDKEMVEPDDKERTGVAKWDMETYTNIIFSDGIIYVPFYRYSYMGSVRAFDAKVGSEIWDSRNVFGTTVWKTMLVDVRSLYVAGLEYNITKLSKKDGTIIWQENLRNATLRLQSNKWLMYSTYDPNQLSIVLVDKETGKELERYNVSETLNTIGAHYRVSDVIALENKYILVEIEDGTWYLFKGSE